MSYDPTSDSAASEMLAAYGQVVSIELSQDSIDSNDGWIGYESAFPFPMDEFYGAASS